MGPQGKQAHNVFLFMLNIVENFIYDFRKELTRTAKQPLLDALFSLLMTILRKSQSTTFTACMFDTLYAFVSKYRQALFVQKVRAPVCYSDGHAASY